MNQQRRRADDRSVLSIVAAHELLARLALAAEYRDDETHAHTTRVGDLAAQTAAVLGCDEQFVETLRVAAPLHDIGKLGVPDSILLKAGPLNSTERAVMQRHTTIGARILGGSTAGVLHMAADIALCHHERWDGTGYNEGLAGTDISLAARIVAIADVADALSHERPYKRAWPLEDVLAEVTAQAGRQFDPAVVEAFLLLDHEALLEPLH